MRVQLFTLDCAGIGSLGLLGCVRPGWFGCAFGLVGEACVRGRAVGLIPFLLFCDQLRMQLRGGLLSRRVFAQRVENY